MRYSEGARNPVIKHTKFSMPCEKFLESITINRQEIIKSAVENFTNLTYFTLLNSITVKFSGEQGSDGGK